MPYRECAGDTLRSFESNDMGYLGRQIVGQVAQESWSAEGEGSMTRPQLFPRQPKRLRQPRKEVLREELRRAADRIIEQGAEIQRLRWWRRLFGKRVA